jgi:hypothetical protein
MRRIQNFTGTLISFWRPNKNTYHILSWNNVARAWRGAVIANTTTFTRHQNPSGGIVEATVHVQKRGSPAVLQCTCDGAYLKTSTNVIIPVLKRKPRTEELPQSCKKEYTATNAEGEAYYTEVELYVLADPVPIQQTSSNRIQIGPQEIPRRIANLVAIDYINKGEDCPITMMPLDISGAKVTSCFHVFDAGAIDEWLKTKKECPVCKTPCVATAAAIEV